MRPHELLLPTALALSILACTTVGEDHEAPQAEVPATWREAPAFAAQPVALERWWQRLDDPLLDQIVERAVGEGLDLRAALARVDEVRALRGVAAAQRLPQVDAFGVYEHRNESETTPFGPFAPETDITTLGFDATWEVDLWGRVRRSVEAADADVAASEEDARDAAVIVAAETARTYVELRAFQLRLEIARRNVSLQEQTLELVSARESAGLVGERDVAQAATNVEVTRSRLPELELGLRAAENRLAVLLGRVPGALPPEIAAALAAPGAVPRAPASFAIGVPADLLRSRADVRGAERRLAAEVARAGVAEADLYPRLSLFGSLGVSSDGTDELFESDSVFSGIGPSLRWNLFDGGALRNRLRAQDARAQQALIAWEKTVLLALEEAENAMTGFLREQVRRSSLGLAADQARRAVELSRTEYEAGLTDFQSVLTSERALADLEDDLALSDSLVTSRLVVLCKALGGGFEHESFASAVAVVTQQ
jgi:NodT family efflux transporter outer membrane factor (OMF) lipoprotein